MNEVISACEGNLIAHISVDTKMNKTITIVKETDTF
jgi:hypothetical protein